MANWPNAPNVVAAEGLKSTMLFCMINMTNPEDLEIYQMIVQAYVWYSFEETIVVRDGFKYTELYGYAAFLPDESENLFVETELPYVFGSVLHGKMFLKSWLVP